MYPHHLASSFILLSITFILHVSTSLCAYDQKYLNCSKPFQCANIKNIAYPFWGQNRPEYCGLSGFKLNCNGGVPEIVINTVPYQVLGINMMSRTLTVARTDLLNNICPKNILNTTLDFDLFNYTSNTETFMLYYYCPLIPELSSQFNCAINGTNFTSYYVTNDVTSSVGDRLRMCNNSIIVHVYQSTVKSLENEAMDLVSALNNGFGLQWIVNNTLCDRCSKSGGQCGYDLSLNEFTCYCPDQPYATNCPAVQIKTGPTISLNLQNDLVAVVFSFGLLCFTYTTIVALCLLCRIKKPKNDKNIEAFIRNHESLAPKRYHYSDVKKMTKSFKKKLGQGGYGSVYKGKLSDGRLVAVKLLSETKGSGEEFINEVASISRTSHVNIVTLLGFCYESTKRALIYEFMPNGSLDKFIYNQESSGGKPQLEWKISYQITVGIARGLEYLHRGCNTRILHFDIKPHNILLDENFCPKIADFGLAKLYHRTDSTISMLEARGTVGYIAPEVFCRNFGVVSHKSDVYSYGMMVLEMVGGRKNFDDGASHTSEIYFPEWIYKQLEPGEDLKLHGVMTKEEEEIAKKMILVSLWCVQTNPSDRPSMTKVVEMLEGSLQSLPIPPKPFLSSPTRSPQYSSA